LALQKGEEINIEHIRAGGQIKEHVLTPAGIVASNQTLYLLAYNDKHKDYTSYAVHRITQVTANYTPVSAPEVGDFLDYVQDGFNEFYVGEDEITLIVDFHPHAQRKMLEYQLADDQQQEVLSDKWLRVKATLYPTGSLLTWLLGYGNLVRVIGPADLVKRLDEMRQAPPAPPLDAPL
jgi:predicted DNA-binding transcriptional regulator YafY